MTNNAVESRQGGAKVRVPPPLLFLAAIAAGAFVPGLRVQGPARIATGLLLLAGGLALLLSALGWFRKTGQDPKPWTPSPELIAQGIYRYSRNPIYLGMTLMTTGIALLAGRLWIAALAPAALLAVHFLAVLPEERYLTSKFGAPYLEYKARVRRYF